MHHKNIKAIIRKQLKTNYRGWKNLTKRKKKQIAKQVLTEVVADYDFSKEIETAEAELLGIAQQELTSGVMDLDEMARFIDSHETDVLFRLNKKPVSEG
jgi:predicted translin family RNA/ssDNA-binding protein